MNFIPHLYFSINPLNRHFLISILPLYLITFIWVGPVLTYSSILSRRLPFVTPRSYCVISVLNSLYAHGYPTILTSQIYIFNLILPMIARSHNTSLKFHQAFIVKILLRLPA